MCADIDPFFFVPFNSIFSPTYVTTAALLYARLEIVPTYGRRSKLRSVPLTFSGLGTQAFFTQWAWNMLTVSFSLSGYIAYLAATGRSDVVKSNPWLLRCAHISFEIASPTELLVASAIKYAIWPRLLKNNRPTANLKRIETLMMHNACVFMILTEVCFLGKIPILLSDIALAPLFGILYILFSWLMSNKWLQMKSNRKHHHGGPQFLYFFLDTTLGMETTLALIILLTVLLSFYFFFWIADDILSHVPSFIGRLGALLLVSSAFCRFRD